MIVPLTAVGVRRDPDAYSYYGDRPTTENYVASDGLLARVLILSVRDKYEASQSTGGFYVGTPNSAKLGELPAISVVAITPSEVFRDTSAEWDKYEIVAAVQFSPFSEATNSAVLWIVARNYLHRNRGGITLGAGGPSPDWSFEALTDFDTTNARLQKIQDGLKAVVDGESGVAVSLGSR